MPRLIHAVPKYRKHRASGQAVVTLRGKDHYLGPHSSKASRLEYDRLISEWTARGRDLPLTPANDHELSIIEVVAAFRRHALQHYCKDGRPTSEICNYDQAVKPLILLYGHEPVREFGPLKLKTVRSLMVQGFTDRHGKPVRALSRGVVNSRVNRLKRIFKWAVSEEMAPPSLAHALAAVTGLQRGRTDCRETKPIGPVDDQVVETTLPFLPDVVAGMVRVQRLTGCRPGEVCAMRPADIDRSASPWEYRPRAHKTAHTGRERVVFIGPQARSAAIMGIGAVCCPCRG